MIEAARQVLNDSVQSFVHNDATMAKKVEPLEQVIDRLRDKLKEAHIKRLTNGECTIELGFILGDLLTNLERVSDHCSNIAGLVLEMEHKEMDIHKYLRQMKKSPDSDFNKLYDEYSEKYSLT